MGLTDQRKKDLDALCRKFRIDLIKVLHDKQTGHPGGSLSVCEILVALYYEKANIDPQNPQMPDRDRIVLTKGHAAPMLYITLANRGYFPVEEIDTLRDIDSRLQGHPHSSYTPGVELSTGPLGIGLSASLGMAIGQKMDKNNAYTYAILGDGELNEGTVWEACMSASKFKADNLITIIDHNGVQLDGTSNEIMPLGDLSAKFHAFGFEVFSCDGHNISSICDSIDKAKNINEKPVVILAKTIKGKGVSFMEGQNSWHGKAISDTEFQQAIAELEG